MAITKVIAIRARLDTRVNYVTNAEKTTLDAGLRYITNPEKTEQSFFVTAINCSSPEKAYREMQKIKEAYKKNDGVLGYHFIQSFPPGEVTPKQAHEIGVAFARELFGERYQAVVGTHLDREHLHSHIIVNSVSFVDGKKYHSSPLSYYNTVRTTSDRLCRENHLQVISPKGQGEPYAAWKAEKQGKTTFSQMLRNEIDLVIRDSIDFGDFLQLLEKKGFAVSHNPNRKYLTVRPPGARRNFRLDKLGEGYRVQDITARIKEKQRAVAEGRIPAYEPIRIPRRRLNTQWRTVRKKKVKGFHGRYFRYIILLRRYRKPTRKRISNTLRREILRLEQYQRQFFYLHTNGITTMAELTRRQEEIEAEIQRRTELRTPLYSQRRHRNMSTSGETADLMVQEGIKITESALKLAGLGAKNLAQLLIAVLNDYEKYAGKTNLKQLIQGNDELTILSIRKEDLAAFHKDSARYGVLYCPIIHKGSDTAEIMARQKDIPQINHILERLELHPIC